MNSWIPSPCSSMYVAGGLLLTIGLIAAEVEPPDNSGIFLIGLFIGQLWLIGGWAAAGRASRLVRGVGALGGMLLMTTVISLIYRDLPLKDEWGRALAPSCIIATPTFASALVMTVIFGRRERFQFKISEVFGWMVIVAIAASVLALAEFRKILSQSEPLIGIAIAGGAAGLLVAVYRFRQSIALRWRLLCWLGFALTMLALFADRDHFLARELSVGFLVAAVYLAGALLASSIDRRLMDASGADEPAAPALGSISPRD